MIKEELRRLYCDLYTLYSVQSLAVLCELQAHVSGILSVVAQMIDGLTDKVQYHYLPVQDTGLHSVQGTVPLPACTRHRTMEEIWSNRRYVASAQSSLLATCVVF